MKDSERLLKTEKLKPGESLMGLILRLTEMNKYETPSWIMEAAGLNIKQLHFTCSFLFDKAVDLTRLSLLTNVDLDALTSLTYPPVDESISTLRNLFSGNPIPKYVISSGYPKICPGCLLESSYCRMAWDLAVVTACPSHWCGLIDECPNCKRRVRWVRKRVSICPCGLDWRRVTMPQVGESELRIARQIFRLCDFSPGHGEDQVKSNNPLYKLELEALLTALLFIASQYKGRTDTKGKFLARSHRVNEIHSLINKASDVFEDWPNNYFSFLDWLSSQNNKSRYPGGLLKDFGGHKSILFNLPASSPLLFMKDGFEEYLCTRWTGGYVSAITRLNIPRRSKKYMPATEASLKLKTDVRAIYQLIKRGELKAVIRKQRRGRVILIDTESVEEVKIRLEDHITTNEVVNLLGVSRQRVHDLVAQGCLELLRGPGQDPFKYGRFSYRQVIDLLNNIRDRIHKNTNGTTENTLTFVEVLRIFSRCRNFGVGRLVKLMLEGVIVPSGECQEPGLKAFTFSEQLIREYARVQQRNSRQDVLGIKEAAKILGVGEDCTYSLVRNGFLEPQGTNKEWSTLMITKEELELFSNTYVPLKIVARELGTTSGRLVDLLLRAGITPVSGPRIDDSHVHLFKRADLEAVNLVALVTQAKEMSTAKRKNYGVFSLDQASKILGIDKRTVKMLADSGRLRPYSPLSRNSMPDSNYYFSYHVVKNYEKSISDFQDLVTSTVAAEMLCERRQIFYDRWIRPGHVKPVITKAARAKYLFRRKDIEKLIELKGKAVF